MIAVLRFDLNEFDDKMAHERCVKATDMACVIFEMSLNARKRAEAVIENRMERGQEVSQHDAIKVCFDIFRELMEKHGVDIERLIT